MKTPTKRRGAMKNGNVVSLREHIEALRAADQKLRDAKESAQEKAVSAAFAAQKEALAIKDRGDSEALRLAREIQTYKDEKANELREQINRERGLYATKGDLIAATEKIEATLSPLIKSMNLQQGRTSGLDKGWAILIGAVGLVGTAVAAVAFLVR